MITAVNVTLLFGVPPDFAYASVVSPRGCIRHKLRLRQGCYATVFLKFADRTEHRYVTVDTRGRLVPDMLIAINHTHTAKGVTQ